jgi:hypothetical protein
MVLGATTVRGRGLPGTHCIVGSWHPASVPTKNRLVSKPFVNRLVTNPLLFHLIFTSFAPKRFAAQTRLDHGGLARFAAGMTDWAFNGALKRGEFTYRLYCFAKD